MSSLAARLGAVDRGADRVAQGQWAAGDLDAALVKIVAQRAEEGEAIRVDPEGDGGVGGVEAVDQAAEVGAGPQRLVERFAAAEADRLDEPVRQRDADAAGRGEDRLVRLEGVANAKGADGRSGVGPRAEPGD